MVPRGVGGGFRPQEHTHFQVRLAGVDLCVCVCVCFIYIYMCVCVCVCVCVTVCVIVCMFVSVCSPAGEHIGRTHICMSKTVEESLNMTQITSRFSFRFVLLLNQIHCTILHSPFQSFVIL